MSAATVPAPRRSRLASTLSTLALAGGALTLAAVPAVADHGPSLSDDETSCIAAGGTFKDLGDGVTTCTVISTAMEDRPSHNISSGFTVEFEVTTTTVYTTTVTEVWVEGPMYCVNPGGQPIPYSAWDPADPLEGNPNCVGAYTGDAHSAAGFTIADDGYWDTVITHDEAVTVTEERVGCRNSAGNSVGAWQTNPNCFTTAP